jgi:hypothetical protein
MHSIISAHTRIRGWIAHGGFDESRVHMQVCMRYSFLQLGDLPLGPGLVVRNKGGRCLKAKCIGRVVFVIWQSQLIDVSIVTVWVICASEFPIVVVWRS